MGTFGSSSADFKVLCPLGKHVALLAVCHSTHRKIPHVPHCRGRADRVVFSYFFFVEFLQIEHFPVIITLFIYRLRNLIHAAWRSTVAKSRPRSRTCPNLPLLALGYPLGGHL